MAENKKSFVLYADQIESIESLTDEEAGKLIKHLFRYVNDLNPSCDDRIVNQAFIPIKNSLLRDLENWKKIKEIRSESGKKGGRPKKQKEAKKPNAFLEKQSEAKKAVSVNVSVSDNVNEIDKEYYFDLFWNAYDKKQDLKKCKEKFLKLSKEDVYFILEVVGLYVKSTPDKKYRKNPLTWLNGRCWEDSYMHVVSDTKYRCEYGCALGKTILLHTEEEIRDFTKSGYQKLISKEAI